jgi:hypothetical protein
MHDAAEAFIGDVNSPLKAMLKEYKRIEHRVEAAIAKRFDLKFPFPPEIKQADILMYRTEAPQLVKSRDVFWHTDVTPLDKRIECWGPAKAKRKWLQRFEELSENHLEKVA